MTTLRRMEKGISILGCILVFAFLLAPRLVVHRHSDLQEYGGADVLLETHLQHFHSADRIPVEPSELHLHWSFSLQPTEVPSSTTSERGLVYCSPEVGLELASLHDSGVFHPHMLERSTEFGEAFRQVPSPAIKTTAFKRVLFSVWNI